ncbi:MAG: hypothetical protein U5L45_14990 [Saprospiraceae bacterium]|nr:hypothetical protein [Saprospiraceae bacterium]
MIIVNPIYDVVFKYLLEDIDIARGLLSTIIGEEIEELTVQPQEMSIRKIQTQEVIRIIRLDFKATIKTVTNEKKIVLIELQKARKLFDIMRFREYLAENYKKGEELVNEKGETEINPLPIITIYFLGFKLDYLTTAVIKVNRVYTDAETGKPIENAQKEPFIENLTHDSYTIQIPFLGNEVRTTLQKVLRVFNQKFKIKDDKHKLDFQENTDNSLVQKILDRLNRAVTSEEILKEMDAEDEVDRLFGKIELQLDQAKQELKGKEKELKDKDKKLKGKEKELKEERQKAEEERQKAEEERQKAEEERQKAEEERQKAEEERQKNQDLEKQLAELKKLLGQ